MATDYKIEWRDGQPNLVPLAPLSERQAQAHKFLADAQRAAARDLKQQLKAPWVRQAAQADLKEFCALDEQEAEQVVREFCAA